MKLIITPLFYILLTGIALGSMYYLLNSDESRAYNNHQCELMGADTSCYQTITKK